MHHVSLLFLLCTLIHMLANKTNDNLLRRFRRTIKSKSRLLLFAVNLKHTGHEMFVKLLVSSLG